MHHAKIGIVAVALAGAIVVVLGLFQRDDDDTGIPDENVNAARAVGRATMERAVGQGWAAFGPAALSVDSGGMTRVTSAPRADEAVRPRTSEVGGGRRAAALAADARVRDPGGDSWRLEGVKREGKVAGEDYLEGAAGERTELTSGRHIGELRVRVPHAPELDIAMAGRDGVPVRAEVCVGKRGKPTEVRVVEGTGVAAVDEHVARQLMAGKYRPLRRDGRRVEFCERTTVIVTSS